MELSLNLLKKIGCLFAKNFPGKLKIYVFGRTARKINRTERATSKKTDIDFLFEVEFEEFSMHAKRCEERTVNFINGWPYDPMDCFWEYHSPKEVRFSAIAEVLKIDEHLLREIVEKLGDSIIDTMMLPFDWKKRSDILEAMNYRDPDFSKNIVNDALLIFEK